MDYPTPRLMDFHFAKHLSPLVLESERETSFDCAATVVLPWMPRLPCQWAAPPGAARGGGRPLNAGPG